MKNSVGGSWLMICSFIASVGRMRPMSIWRVRSRALLRGRTWSMKRKLKRATATPAMKTGRSIWVTLTPARPHGRDLVVGREMAEPVEHRHQHRHRQRERDDEGQEEEQHFGDDVGREALAHEVPETLRHLVEEEKAGERAQGKGEGPGELAQEVPREEPHAV
jgi:hypothetical protein